MTSSLDLQRNGAVGFIVWLGDFSNVSPVQLDTSNSGGGGTGVLKQVRRKQSFFVLLFAPVVIVERALASVKQRFCSPGRKRRVRHEPDLPVLS
jgi:hypothetical protein